MDRSVLGGKGLPLAEFEISVPADVTCGYRCPSRGGGAIQLSFASRVA
jgi:hypothetical protein